MWWRKVVWMSCTWALGGCMPTRASVTAGHVGCAPKEITISGESMDTGLYETNETWLAACRGRHYVCTKTTSSGFLTSTLDPKSEKQTSFQIACREQLEAVATSVPAPSASPGPAPAQLASTAPKQFAPPKGAAGFDFGFTSVAAKAACEKAGNVWSDGATSASCSGPATNVGFQAAVGLTFCQGALCSISVRVADPTDFRTATDEFRAKLSEKYGAPGASGAIRPECSGSDGFARCFKDGGERLNYTWTWSSGELLQLSVGRSATDGDAAIRLQYERDPKLSVDAAGL